MRGFLPEREERERWYNGEITRAVGVNGPFVMSDVQLSLYRAKGKEGGREISAVR